MMATNKLHLLERFDARVPRWNMEALTKRNCPFCSVENEPLLVRPDLLPVAFCSGCGCWYVARLPSISDLKNLYDGYYRVHHPTDLSEKRVSRMIEDASKSSLIDWRLNMLSRLLGGLDGRRIMDVGCGWGSFLLMAKAAGIDAVGCDLSLEACSFARDRLGLNVYQSDLRGCSSDVGTLDAVVMKNLIEHSVNPWLDVQAALDVLKPGGLVLLYTPNGGEAGTALETAKRWIGFRVDLEHLQYLSPYTINWLSQKCDLCIERLEAYGFPMLDAIDKLPGKGSNTGWSLREALKKIPCARRIVEIMRTMKAATWGQRCDPRLGSYHLIAIVRKTRLMSQAWSEPSR